MFGGISLKEVATFTRQFGTMVNAGVPVVKSLRGMADQMTNKRFQSNVNGITTDVEEGLSMHEAFDKRKKIFGELYVAMVRAGEEGGFLGACLINIANWFEKSIAIQRKIKMAMAYPAVIFVVAVGVLIFMLTMIIPTFASMFERLGSELPALTQAVVSLSTFMRNYIWLVILIIIGLILLWKYLIRRDDFKTFVDTLTFRIPIFGTLIQKTAISRFSVTMSSLLTSGVPVVDSLRVTAKTAGNKVIENTVLMSAERIAAGESIVGPLRASGVFPPIVTQLIATGEESGQLPDMLEKISVFYDEEVDATVSNLTAVLEPIMIVVMGGLVGVMLVSMYLPMFDIVGQMK